MQSMANGKRAGIITALGLVTGILVHTSLVAFGVSAIIKESEELFLIIRIFGALYLFYLAYRVHQSKEDISIDTYMPVAGKEAALFKRGFIMNVLNPKVTIFFLAFLPGFLWEPGKNLVYQFYLLGFVFIVQAIIVFTAVAFLAGKISAYLKYNSASAFYLKWVQVMVFIGIGLFILL